MYLYVVENRGNLISFWRIKEPVEEFMICLN